MSVVKDWKFKPFDFETFRETWDSNFRVEVASGLLYTLENAEEITKKDKVGFFIETLSRLSVRSGIRINVEGFPKDPEQELFSQAMEYFFDLVPEWEDELSEFCVAFVQEILGRNALHKFGNRDELKRNFSSKIRRFLNSVLNTQKKEKSIFWDRVGWALVYNEMFEELVNYSFIDVSVLNFLADRLGIGKCNNVEFYSFNGADITRVLAENKEPKVISAFLRLLAKRAGENMFKQPYFVSDSRGLTSDGNIWIKLS